MKTAEKILLTSLELFNQQGEANVTCVDIALELDISPGNLYYHFRGKEVIVNALFDLYLARASKILVSPSSEELNIERFFYYLYCLLDSAHLYRFIYRNPTDLIHKYPTIARSFEKLLHSKEQAFAAILEHFQQQGTLHVTDSQLQSLTQLINLVFTQSQNYFLLTKHDVESEDISFQSLCWIHHSIAPYLTIDEAAKHALMASIKSQATSINTNADGALRQEPIRIG
ncbi:TetR/AcrR family transcriptional regulator [Thalassotalea euphylliae]|uniref:TetR/AcrR family transcriptional regulator n=1 Tax=Thalassotalea euphylliae TaxID=1655234 RepID=A0A3E0TT91_9GAMM|nr:TetR/AcrR family transcriptional regulator [Thalassotalea euphylliae]REL27640.1 TetR/AcrR family transcriptional regulator [Thalassotalea euphylliae]